MRARVKRLESVLFGPESAARLWWTHTALAVLIGLRIVLGPYRQLDPTPDGLFRPTWFLSWLPGMPSATAFAVMQVIGGLAVVAFVLRRWPRATFALAWVVYLVLAGLRESRGKIMHNDVLLLLTSVPFLVAPLTPGRRDRTPDDRFGWPINTGIAVVTLGYFFAGYWKLMRSGLSWVTSDNVRLSIAWGPKPAVGRWDAFADFVSASPWLGKVIAATTLAFEISFPVALFVRRRTRSVRGDRDHTAPQHVLHLRPRLLGLDRRAVDPVRRLAGRPGPVAGPSPRPRGGA